ncbi:hypothetical protein [Natronolimnobius baerhuensis]|uniref:Uncharacterized protein n=1 Tax=Natronolimnobius baerhuensis TaxID=253108 RepID=A0A202EE19_9EURY|nr:hypothetical protein [Natronolimnobius baerhuensis]OVE86280.1 hypothetical protein B2G88_05730 [Natronolimnobius baerhuensis]
MSLHTTIVEALSLVLYHGYDGTEGLTGFPNIGTWIIFGVVLVPIYVMIIAWFAGVPRDTKLGGMGVVYLIGITAGMWVPMFFLTVLIGIVFFGGAPEPIGSAGPP